MDRNMIDATSDGALMNKTPTTTRNLISHMASNTQQFRTREAVMSRASCWTTSDEFFDKNLWHLYLYGALNRCVPHIIGNRAKQCRSRRQFTFDGRVDKAIECKSENIGRTTSHHSESTIPKPKPIDTGSEPKADLLVQQQARAIPLLFPTQIVPTRKSETDEELLKMFQRIEINIPLLDAIKQIPKYMKFLKELCMHKRKKMKEGVKMGGVVSALIKSIEVFVVTIFFVPYTIGDCTFIDVVLDLGASINVMLSSIYKSLHFGDLEPMFDFYVLAMEDEMFGKGSTLILRRPFLMTV
ncbi:hypothetical protein CR513_38770, partial [Mucuna pruriens]